LGLEFLDFDLGDAQQAAGTAFAGPDVDAGFAQRGSDLADLAADGAHVVGQVTGGHPGVGTDPPEGVEQLSGGAFPRAGV
jgi:hypothetical protein